MPGMASATVQVNVRLDPQVYAALKRKAKRDGNTVTAAVDEAVRAYTLREKGAA